MARKIARGFVTLLGIVIGIGLVEAINQIFVSLGMMSMYDVLLPWVIPVIFIVAGLVCGIISFIFSPRLIAMLTAFIHETETMLADMALVDIFFGVVGLVIGLVIAFLLSTLTASISFSWVRLTINIALYVMLGYLGWSIVTKRKGEINIPSWFKRGQKDKTGKTSGTARPKILDTSVIIDGRIADICRTGIIEGTLIVPGFVLQELRHIADSADSLKRNRGRRGLDILNKMQQELDIPIKVNETDYDDIAEVDAKLIKLAYDMGGVVVTNDYNLNKVAGVQRVPVFNINELANAIKPVVLPGEEMTVTIVKEGKEAGQGVAYLDDGTMIVVDGGRRRVGDAVEVVVTSVLQTSAGRMIFAKIK
ncbi:PIN/TRAM domain-containing protein [bacterium]|nr:PIN/TRAM domain-containing protein [bacterium]MDD5919678.1 PIN/TRAM domain-containing protein [bacterium]